MNYYRRYVGDYLRDTMRLTPTDHGVYGLMLDFYYAEERPLPLDLDEIHAICKAIKPDDRKSVDKVLAGYFRRAPDGYHNNRADKEIATSQQARKNGQSGGRPPTGSLTGTLPGLETGTETKAGTGSPTGQGAGSGHPPTTNHQPPTTTRQPPPKAGASRGSRLTLDIMPAEWMDFAKQERPDLNPGQVFNLFRDHWIAQPGSKGVKLDWAATWRNWVRKEGPAKINGAAHGKSSIPQYVRDGIKRNAAAEAQAHETLVGSGAAPQDERDLHDQVHE